MAFDIPELAMRCCLILEARRDIDWTKRTSATKAAQILRDRFDFSKATGHRYVARYRDAKGIAPVERRSPQVARVKSGTPHPWKTAKNFVGIGR